MGNKMFSTRQMAYYDHWGQFIMINSEKDSFQKLLSEKRNIEQLECENTLIHEYRHCLDNLGTNFGQKLLAETYRTMSNVIMKKKVEMHVVSPLIISEKVREKSLFEIFVKEELNSDNENYFWKFDLTDNYLNNYPIQITKFSSVRGYKICNTPVLFTSLFEANSIYEELHNYNHFSLSEYGNNSDKKFLDLDFYMKYAKQSLNSEMIEYSTATHFIAAIFELPHVLNSYDITSQICTIILNLTDQHLEAMRYRLDRNNNKSHFWYFRNRDFGYIIKIICEEYKSIQKGNPIFDIEHFLQHFGSNIY